MDAHMICRARVFGEAVNQAHCEVSWFSPKVGIFLT